MKLSLIIRKDLARILFVCLAFILMALTSCLFVSRIVGKQIFNHAKEILLTAETHIRSDLREAEVTLINISLFVENRLKTGWSLEDLRSYLVWQNTALLPRETVPGYSNIFCYVDGTSISGRLDWELPGDFRLKDSVWFNSARKAQGGTAYSSPHMDAVTGEYVLSLIRMMGGEENPWFIGIDLNLVDTLFAYINTLQFEEGGYGLLLDKDFNLLVHPNSEILERPVEGISPGTAGLVRALKADPGGVVVQRIRNWKGAMMVMVAKRLYNGWYLGIATPSERYYGDMRSMIIVLSILGLGFMSILSIFLIRLSILKARSDEESRDKSSFLARMSHEIRTPMNSILGVAELIQRKAISSEIQEYISIISQAGVTLLTIINDILDFSRIESGRLQIEKRNYHLASVINDMINMIRPRAAEKSLDFFVDVDGSIPAELVGDDVRIRQVLVNLLSNAVKYTKKGFLSLDVGVERLDNHSLKLIFTIRDSGIGLKKEDLDRLFTEFYRADAKSNLGVEGTGLGLVITRALCRAMNGDVVVESEYGTGSVFRASVIQEYENGKPVAQVNNPGEKNVLFYDGRPRYVESMTRVFKCLEVSAEGAKDLGEFLEALERGNYDYAFISSKHAMESIPVLDKRKKPLRLVIMVEMGEVSVFREVSSIMMPVYSVTLASVLNNHIHDGVVKNAKFHVPFTAPSARVLIVDDIFTNLRVAKELMVPYNMNIHTSLSGTEAVDMVKKDFYDLVFMDHMMPGMDGLEASAIIRRWEKESPENAGTGEAGKEGRRIPIIALTANAITGQREMFLKNGIDDFLAKPIDIQKLNGILEKWIPREKRVDAVQTIEPNETGETKQGKAESLSIPGLDIEAGLRNVGGSRTVYLDIIADFCRDLESRTVNLSEALDTGNTKLYITLVHALKGAARSIGAVETGEAAAWLENAAGKEDTALIRRKNDELLENLRTLSANIKAAANQRDGAGGGLSVLCLETLRSALSEMDMEAVNKMLLEYSNLSLDSQTREIVAGLEQHILMFEYDEAVKKIDQLLGQG